MIAKEEIVSAIINAKDYDVAVKHFGGDYNRFVRECGVTKADLLDYVRKHGFPSSWIRLAPSTYDGIYILEQNNEWVIYEQERGEICAGSRMSVRTRDEALDVIVERYYVLKERASDFPP